jgi:tRNA nucleotidyltransferase/poly(A) polymerase
MRLWTDPALDPIFAAIRKSLDDDQQLFLVGGAVRDLILEQPINDLDFVMGENPVRLAKKIAKQLNAGFFMLDDERHTARVIYQLPDGDLFCLDFVQFTGKDLEEDLGNRDFTINAMALSTRDPETLIDPLGGWADLEKGIIRPCSKHALLDDPVRTLRAVRLAYKFGFSYGTGIDRAMKAAVRKLPQTTPERRRDAFFRILEGPDPAAGLRDCYRFGILESLIPPIEGQADIPASPPHHFPLLDHTFRVVEGYQQLLDMFTQAEPPEDTAPWWLIYAFSALNGFTKEIRDYFSGEITPGRTVNGLALFGALLHDIAKPETKSVGDDGHFHYYGHDQRGAELALELAKEMRLSNAEANWLQTMVRYHMRLLPMIKSEEGPTRKALYRFFQSTGEVGIGIAFLSLADTLGTYGPELDSALWEKSVAVVKTVMQTWWRENMKIVSPKLFLDGNDLQNEFHLKPGVDIGKLLASLREAQASGEVVDKEQAHQFIQDRLDEEIR